MNAALYTRVSTYDQQTLPFQLQQLRHYVNQRGWKIVLEIEEIGSGVKQRPGREQLIRLARRRSLDVIVVSRLDRWGRSLADLIVTLNELKELNVGFISLQESLDLTTPTGKAMAGMLAVFAEFERDIIRERVKAGIENARALGKEHGRPATAVSKAQQVKLLFQQGKNKSQIASELGIGRSSVTRILK